MPGGTVGHVAFAKNGREVRLAIYLLRKMAVTPTSRSAESPPKVPFSTPRDSNRLTAVDALFLVGTQSTRSRVGASYLLRRATSFRFCCRDSSSVRFPFQSRLVEYRRRARPVFVRSAFGAEARRLHLPQRVQHTKGHGRTRLRAGSQQGQVEDIRVLSSKDGLSSHRPPRGPKNRRWETARGVTCRK